MKHISGTPSFQYLSFLNCFLFCCFLLSCKEKIRYVFFPWNLVIVDQVFVVYASTQRNTFSPTSFGRDLRSPSCHKLDVAHLEDGGQQLEHVSDLLLAEFHHFQGLLHTPAQTKSGNMSTLVHEQLPPPPDPHNPLLQIWQRLNLICFCPPPFLAAQGNVSVGPWRQHTSQHVIIQPHSVFAEQSAGRDRGSNGALWSFTADGDGRSSSSSPSRCRRAACHPGCCPARSPTGSGSGMTRAPQTGGRCLQTNNID